MPFFTSLAAFFILYMLVPNKTIKAKHAAAGALLAALLFEFSKKGFALYVSSFSILSGDLRCPCRGAHSLRLGVPLLDSSAFGC